MAFWIGTLTVLVLHSAIENRWDGFRIRNGEFGSMVLAQTLSKFVTGEIKNEPWFLDTCWLVLHASVALFGGYLCLRFTGDTWNQREIR